MNAFDVILAVLLLYGFIKGFTKGLFVEIASLAALISGVWGAIHFSYFIAAIMEKYVDWSEHYISLTAFAITFIAIVIVIASLGKLFTKLADFAALGLVNKILGGVFGFLKIAFIMSILLLFFSRINTAFSFVDKDTVDNSILYAPIKSMAPAIFPSIIKEEHIEMPKII
ncbi:MAG: CvpA family protein [Flavobacteriaceae bacterium]|nr:MAG: CvpA family protein [Flavobacteriaceae bacterium]